jgi:hypothetical protein
MQCDGRKKKSGSRGGRREPTKRLANLLAQPANQTGAPKKPRHPKGPSFHVTRTIPRGLTVEEAKQRSAEALAEWLAEGAR